MKLNVEGAARLFQVSTKTIYRWASAGKIPGYRVNKQYRFDRTELLEWAAAQHVLVDEHQAAEPSDEPIPTFGEALEGGGVHYRVTGADRDDVLRSTVAMLRLVDAADRGPLFDALRARESLAPTTIGDGFALPHLRNPLRFQIERASVNLCYLESPVSWAAPDGSPVHTLFVVVGPTVRSVLRLHVETWFALRDPGFRAAVQDHATRDVIFAEAARVARVLRRPEDLR